MIAKYLLILALIIFVLGAAFFLKNKTMFAKNKESNQPIDFYNIKINALSGTPLDLNKFQNKVLLIVNVASKCGFTSQYKDLESLYQKYKSKDLVVIGVPSNDFGGQEPGTAKDIDSFCKLTYGVSFPMSEKVKINGDKQHELYDFLTQSNTKYSGNVKWNFTKFLIDKNGNVVDRFSPATKPLSKKILKRIIPLIE